MKDIKKIDKTLLIMTIIYSIFGLMMILSASSASTILRYQVSSNHFFIRQLIVLVAAYIAGFIVLLIPTRKYKGISYLGTIGIFFLLLLVLVKGEITNNAQSWFAIGPFNLQPSEFAKTVLILFSAVFYHNLTYSNNKNLSLYFIPLCVDLAMTFLIAKQPDWGSAAILLAISGLTFLSVPMIQRNMSKILKLGMIGIVLVGAILMFKGGDIFTSEKLSRFNFKNPCTRYREDTGYQVCNGLIAISNGGLFGVGLGQSTQKYMYLPESHTDFIFPIICEELGAIIGTIVIIGYGIMLLRMYKIAKGADNLRTSLIAYGAFWYFALHIIVNLLGVLALIPLTGVPLPFLSYGGSYTLNAILMVFCVERVAIENKKNRFNREMSKIK
ncbi:MAG: FtsW/RodA/SpoVE family cell cycle protein [Firmicutes bacterium]|nr:FtsW/RodA/SpoVE family cell cycle protein [Bacillota bacterium]